MNLCIRVGDSDDYHNLDDLSDLADHLKESNVRTPLVRHSKYAVTTDGFERNNHISLFWGDDEAQPIRELTPAELDEINRRLAE